MLHEILHWVGDKSEVAKKLDYFMNEGLTEWQMFQILGDKGSDAVGYDVNVKFVLKLAEHIGEQTLEKAFLHSQWTDFQQKLDMQAGNPSNARNLPPTNK